MALVTALGLAKSFPTHRNVFGRTTHFVSAVRGVDITVEAGETLAIVGESGSGKSTLARLLLRLVRPDAGFVAFEGTDLSSLSREALRLKRRDMQMIFQDPYASLDPRIVIGAQIAEVMKAHKIVQRNEEWRPIVSQLLAQVGLADSHMERFPYEFSGGQLQRIAIARALATSPKFLVCDEPVAALDMSIRAQVINLLCDVQRERHLAVLFISHDVSLVRHIADRVAVMLAGEIVEINSTEAIFESPRHEYTKSLLDSVPDPSRPRRRGLRSSSTARNNGTVV